MAEFRLMPPMSKRLRNSLMSIMVCAGLMIAYHYYTAQSQGLPDDTHITYEMRGRFRLDVDSSGHVRLLADKVYSYKISTFAVRRILRVFHRARFFERNVTAYGAVSADCTLTLVENHQKSSIRHACDTQSPELTKPIEALDQMTRFRRVLKGDKSVLRDYAITSDNS
ncbi:hypothetical protein AEAC466_15840 [Asticcacaulis sp. AC466]|uniref:hypothetical protein n=1 Tax=Asticcacaulis sp. AC466 TaxID=1282362 RepID=UPI0003C3E604|nr:hypothetical protein [Asticcacaulis sp. AC466]ESQ82976.1 hypothetical protein AEAC466_15840 [Asticcacaulis sp. AC466]